MFTQPSWAVPTGMEQLDRGLRASFEDRGSLVVSFVCTKCADSSQSGSSLGCLGCLDTWHVCKHMPGGDHKRRVIEARQWCSPAASP